MIRFMVILETAGAEEPCPKTVFKGIANASPNPKTLCDSEYSRFFNPFQLLRKSPWSRYFLG